MKNDSGRHYLRDLREYLAALREIGESVNDDIDAANTKEVVWAFATRCHPASGEIHFNKEATSPLVAFLEGSEKMSGRTTKVVACLPRTGATVCLCGPHLHIATPTICRQR